VDPFFFGFLAIFAQNDASRCRAYPPKPTIGSTVTVVCTCPAGVQAWTTDSGSISGQGLTAKLSTAGVSSSLVTVTAACKGIPEPQTVSIVMALPPAAPQPHVQSLCSVSFDNDKNRPTRVDNEAKACLDEIALNLQRQSDATLVTVGQDRQANQAGKARAQQRAVNVKDYLVRDKGIDAARVQTRSGPESSNSVQMYIVPAGANVFFDIGDTEKVDEKKVKPIARYRHDY
jgi:outer membrane protein OmpA-like peptidoglycan-associated protein